jgi:hypothetical protein
LQVSSLYKFGNLLRSVGLAMALACHALVVNAIGRSTFSDDLAIFDHVSGFWSDI